MNWKNRIHAAYSHFDARKPDNPELIDVRNRFRIIEIDGREYVTKKATPEDAVRERSLAIEANIRLNNHFADGLLLQVVVPEVVIYNDSAYLITPYLGKTLQSIRYTQARPLIQQNTLQQILQVFRDCGIRYRGFLPRNAILGNGILYLIDWEDTIFFDVGVYIPGNMISETNFVLNWMYSYDAVDLRAMYRCVYQTQSEHDTPLNQYEKILCHLCGQRTTSVADARKFVDTMVLAAEAPCKDNYSNVILPTDCASVIADIFTPHLDAFFDILSSYLRKEDEDSFFRWMNFLGTYIRDNPNTEAETKGQVFSILLMMCLISGQIIDEFIDEDSGRTLSILQSKLQNIPLIYAFLQPDAEQLKQELWPLLMRITGNPRIKDVKDSQILMEEILTLSTSRHNTGKLIWENSFYRFIRFGKTAAIPGSYVLLRKKKSRIFSEKETICFAESVRMIRLFLAEENVSITGIYTQGSRDGDLTTLILPYHISVLHNLNIPLDEYQPYIESYLNYFQETYETSTQCEIFDGKFKSFANTYKIGR